MAPNAFQTLKPGTRSCRFQHDSDLTTAVPNGNSIEEVSDAFFFLKSNAEIQYCNKPGKQPSSKADVQSVRSVPTQVNHGEAHAPTRHKLRLPNCLEPPPSLPPTTAQLRS